MAGKWVLVVDDDQDSRDLVVELLQGEGYRAIAAPDGAVALKMMGEHAPALVLSDLVMSEMGGRELFARSQDLLGPATPPFVFLTGVVQPSTLANLPATVLCKPYELDQLLGLVEQHCAN